MSKPWIFLQVNVFEPSRIKILVNRAYTAERQTALAW